MSFWDKVTEELKKAAQGGWEAVRGGAKLAVEKSEEMAKIGKLRYRIYTNHKQAEKLFNELGGMVYEMAKPPYENPLSRPEVTRLIEEIRKVEDEIARLEEEIENIRRGGAEAKEEKEAEKPAAEEKPEPVKTAEPPAEGQAEEATPEKEPEKKEEAKEPEKKEPPV